MQCNIRYPSILLLLFVMFCVSGVHRAHAQKFTIGVKGGLMASKSAFGDKDDKDEFTNTWKPGYFGAALINFPLKDNFSFQTEFGYSQRGRKVKFNNDTWSNKATYRHLDAVMLLRKSYPLKWSRDVKGTWFFNIGPRISYWINGNGTVTSGGFYTDSLGIKRVSQGGSYDYKVKFSGPSDTQTGLDFNTMYLTDVNRWLFGLDIGIGVDAPTTALQRFVFEVRYTSGHTFYGGKNSAFNRTLGFTDNLRANEKILSVSIDYTLNKDARDAKKGKSTIKESNKSRSRRKIDSLLH